MSVELHPPSYPAVAMQGAALPLELRVASKLWVDELAGRVAEALAREGVESILLKGASIANWLYGPEEVRIYGDADLLVSPENWRSAQDVLYRLGFEKVHMPLFDVRVESLVSEAWSRGRDEIDLHRSIWGLGCRSTEAWAVLSQMVTPMQVGRRSLMVLEPSARAMHLALHAAQHGGGWPVADLERAADLLEPDIWRRAAETASAVNATPAFVAGLQMVDGGAAIVQAVGLDGISPSADAWLRTWRVPLSQGIGQLMRTRGVRDKADLIRRVVFPSSEFMRWWSPIARRGRLGLGMSYAWRVLWCGVRLVPALRAWRRAQAAGPVAPAPTDA